MDFDLTPCSDEYVSGLRNLRIPREYANFVELRPGETAASEVTGPLVPLTISFYKAHSVE